MTSPSIATGQLPDLTTVPSVAGTTGTMNVGARPVASSTTDAAQDSAFSRLMNLQGRGRALEAKLTKQASNPTTGDPAAAATAAQAKFTASQVQELRELVGPTPGTNGRKALAALIARIEGGSTVQPTDQARIKLAIAADQQRVELAGALAYKDAILLIDKAFADTNAQTADPTMAQDPAKLASFQDRSAQLQQIMGQLTTALGASRLDPAAATALVAQAARSNGS